jgi:hypothetical protein
MQPADSFRCDDGGVESLVALIIGARSPVQERALDSVAVGLREPGALFSGGVMNSTDLPATEAMDFTASPKPATNCLETSAVGMDG